MFRWPNLLRPNVGGAWVDRQGIRNLCPCGPDYAAPVGGRPIGMFDSGFGGLTVARAVMDLLPNEDLIYLGDTGRYPYGSKPLEVVQQYALEIADHLVADHDVKFLIVACNTATAAALEVLEQTYQIPVIGVIEPGVRAVVERTDSRRIGVIGTVGTVSSGAYEQALAALHTSVLSTDAVDGGVSMTTCACPGLVEFVERGEITGPQVEILAERLLQPIVDADVDALLLGCTHYPYLARAIRSVVGPHVVLVSSADETAFAAAAQLAELGLLAPERSGSATFISSGDVAAFTRLGSRLLGPELADAHSWRPQHAP